MRLIKPIMAAMIVFACAFVAIQGLPNSVAADTISDAEKVHPRTYRLADLPVWSQDGKTFNATILMAYLKASVDPNAWGKASTMAPYTECLVISTNSANHDAIHDVIEQLRESTTKAAVR
ncbi:hypothetical protein [Novipirellula sp.]|uniref:hypothetical protein n=1 Tax=Novipirellula sp. TaxID=2795430 RepID=UPI003562D4C8